VRERRALTAQARASAWVVAGLPVLLLAGMLVTGRLRPASDPALGLVIGVGVVLQALGVIVVWSMLRRAT
jgi:Flp pilus assembly protein TadB